MFNFAKNDIFGPLEFSKIWFHVKSEWQYNYQISTKLNLNFKFWKFLEQSVNTLFLYPIIFQIRNSVDENTSPDGNVTVSTLSLVPSVLEAGSLLVCQAGNPRIQDSTLESAWKLEIHCKYFIRKIIIFHIKLFFLSIMYTMSLETKVPVLCL